MTRTIATGPVDPAVRQQFTAVLRGHIALASAVFPPHITGGDLDLIARLPLWRMGLDYSHSTGHGVGSYLSVHEGPQKIRRGNDVPLRPGMIVSNEPGYYEPGRHGMRMESLMVVTEARGVGASRAGMLAFEIVTMAPIDRRMIDIALLSAEDIAWIDAYHAIVLDKFSPLLASGERMWLGSAACHWWGHEP